jgi:hypothetical protein
MEPQGLLDYRLHDSSLLDPVLYLDGSSPYHLLETYINVIKGKNVYLLAF